MGKIGRCLKAAFISCNTLFKSFGFGLIGFLQKDQVKKLDIPNITWVWVIAFAIFGISMLGIYAVVTENKCCLKLFAVLMGIAMVLLVIFGVVIIVFKDEIIKALQDAIPGRELMKIDFVTEKLNLQCCGWNGVEDVGSDIPEFCSCKPSYRQEENAECKPHPQGDSSSYVYSKPCREAFVYYIDISLKIALGIIFGFTIIPMMGLIISANMIKQISRHDRAGMPAFAMRDY